MKPSKDFYMECNDGESKLTPQQFEEIFCSQCKNRECVRASWGYSSWDKRILTQVDRLLDNPNIVKQSESSRWEGIADLEVFQEQQSETWGSSSKPLVHIEEPKIEVKPTIIEVKPTIEVQDCQPPEVQKVEPRKADSSFNTPAQSFNLGGHLEEVKPVVQDPWAVSKTVAVGGKFKMGG